MPPHLRNNSQAHPLNSKTTKQMATEPNQQPKPPIKLCTYPPPRLSPTETFQRTSQYAQDPTTYLLHTLGKEAFESQKPRLILPNTPIDLDTYGKGTHKQNFEAKIASFFGKKAALFFLTGTQAQLATLKVYCERAGRNIVAWHYTAHPEIAEESSWRYLYGFERILLGNKEDQLPTLEEIQSVLNLPLHKRPAVILLEIPCRPLGCQTYTFSQLKVISDACQAADVALHCDGARIWETESFYNSTSPSSSSSSITIFQTLGPLFTSLYLSFYKALQSITGAILLHNDPTFILQLSIWQRRAGGNAYTLAYEVIDCERAVNEIWGGGKCLEKRVRKLGRVIKRIGEEVGRLEESDGRGGRDGGIFLFQPAIPVTFEINTWFAAGGGGGRGGGGGGDDGRRRRRGYTEQELLQARDIVQEKTNIRVFEKLAEGKFPERILREEREEEEVLVRELEGLSTGVDESGGKSESRQQAGNATADAANNSEKTETLSAHYFGWGLSSLTENLDDEVFVKGYVELWKELVRIDEGREGVVG